MKVTEYASVADADLEQNSLEVVEHAYDAFNQWISRTVDPDGDSGTAAVEKTFFLYDQGQIILQFDKTGTGDATTGDLSHRYLWGAAVDQLLADESATGEVLWALTDHLNTVRDLAEYDDSTATTTIANHRTYDAFGNLISEADPTVDSLFGYTGRPMDEATGLQNNLNRWYDAQSGQWISEDPIGFEAGDANLVRYVANNPLSGIDPTGLQVAAPPALSPSVFVSAGAMGAGAAAAAPIAAKATVVCAAGYGGYKLGGAIDSAGLNPFTPVLVGGVEGYYWVTDWVGSWFGSAACDGEYLRQLEEARRAFNQNGTFRRWFHRVYKQEAKGDGNRDLTLDEILDALNQWEAEGRPNVK